MTVCDGPVLVVFQNVACVVLYPVFAVLTYRFLDGLAKKWYFTWFFVALLYIYISARFFESRFLMSSISFPGLTSNIYR